MTTICVDAMGGDETPDVVLSGIEAALSRDADLSVLVAGDEDVVVPFCESHDRAKALVTTEVIGMAEHPAEAVRAKKDSSIVRGCAAIRAGEADGFFSAGSTGAIFAAATLGVGRIRGIKRPAIACAVPGSTGRSTVFLDMGANADVRPEMVVQFAQMGRAYSRVTLGVEDPKVALLSNGTEDTKGSEAVVAEHEALKAAGGDWFVGNCEGSDILRGVHDVIVTDAFAAKVGALLLKKSLKGVAASLSGDEYGGAFLLGLKAPVLIGHGATSKDAVMHGTLACAAAVRGELVRKIAEDISQDA